MPQSQRNLKIKLEPCQYMFNRDTLCPIQEHNLTSKCLYPTGAPAKFSFVNASIQREKHPRVLSSIISRHPD